MFKKIIISTALVVVLVAGTYLESLWHVTPFFNAGFMTAKTMLVDLYAYFTATSLNINSTAVVFALTGFLALLSARYLFGARKM